MELDNKRALVVGAGRTGIATARFLKLRGATVTITDSEKKTDIPRELLMQGVDLVLGEHPVRLFLQQDLIVVSPGVSLLMRPIIEAKAAGIEVISEVELAYRHMHAPLIAVTGTNGKTTTTSLLRHLFNLAGKNIFVGGNIGTPLIECALCEQEFDYVIAEISSFQLEGIRSFKPAVSVLLNVTEDHLDRYPSFNEYRAAKGAILMNQGPEEFAVLNYDDTHVRMLGEQASVRKFYFSAKTALARGAYDNGAMHCAYNDRDALTLSTEGAVLAGSHNRENMLAAISVAYLCGFNPAVMQEALRTYAGLPHRMEAVAEIAGIRFYNDSKGTNVGACVKSLESLTAPIVLIAGGKDKGGSYAPLRPLIERKVKALILLGEAKERMSKEIGDAAATVIVDSLDAAVCESFTRAATGDTVLFSPACSSFDMFANYEERGERFKQCVAALTGTN